MWGVISLSAYKEIVTKAVIGKGKKYYRDTYTVNTNTFATINLGCICAIRCIGDTTITNV